MKLFLENDCEYEIVRNSDNRFYTGVRGLNGDPKHFVKLGCHERFLDAFDDLAACRLSLEEIDSLHELKDVVADLAARTEDWFARHDEYLATL